MVAYTLNGHVINMLHMHTQSNVDQTIIKL